jgi:O-6-methylguanine DNA methyltransferase
MPTEFERRVIAVARRIPSGRVATYGDLARLAGSPRASRAVGNIMRGCTDPRVPCHRVVGAGGALGGYGRNPQIKRELLRAEGVLVGTSRIRGFDDVHWNGRR